MKLEIIKYVDDEYGVESDYQIEIRVETNKEKIKLKFQESEPEDNTFSRDLSDVYKISDVIKAAYEAGLRGEVLEIIETKES